MSSPSPRYGIVLGLQERAVDTRDIAHSGRGTPALTMHERTSQLRSPSYSIQWAASNRPSGLSDKVSYSEVNTSISQINFFLSLVNAKRELFSPLVIVGSQIFERPSGGRYGGRWISDRYLKSNIYQIFGVQKSIKHETGSNPRPRETGSSHVGNVFHLTIGAIHYLYSIAI